jgi:excisionase family DNA binding protein
MTRPTAAKKQTSITAKRASTARDEQAWEPSGISEAASATAPYDPLLTIEQVSDWLGVPKGTLYQWRSRNQGPRAIKVGGGLRYRRNEVDAYLDRHTDSRSA